MGHRRRASSSSSSDSAISSPITAPGTNSTSSADKKPSPWAMSQTNNSQHPARGSFRRPWTAQRIAQLRSIAIPKDEPAVAVTTAVEAKNLISVNSEGQRVDRPLQAPSADALQAFHGPPFKPCQHLAINEYSPFGDLNCELDHTPLNEEMIHVMHWTLRHNPCGIGSGCRWQQCKRGHTCQRPGCRGAGFRECQLPIELHNINGRLAKWVRSIGLHSDKAWREQIRHARYEASQGVYEDDWDQRATKNSAPAQDVAWDQPANRRTSWDEPLKSQQSSWDEPSSEAQQNSEPVEKQSSRSSTSATQTLSRAGASQHGRKAADHKAKDSDWYHEQFGSPAASETPSWDQSNWEQANAQPDPSEFTPPMPLAPEMEVEALADQEPIWEQRSSETSTSASKVDAPQNQRQAAETKANDRDWHYEQFRGPPASEPPSLEQSDAPHSLEQQTAMTGHREDKSQTSSAPSVAAPPAEEAAAPDLVSISDASEDEAERVTRIGRIRKTSQAAVANSLKPSVATKSVRSPSSSGKSSSSHKLSTVAKSSSRKSMIPEGVWKVGKWR